MAFGIDTLAALNDPNFNWANFKQWKGEWPQFVARYFGGNEDATFGEFAAFKTTTGGKCHYVVPAQASVVSNQQMTGNAGLSQGATDAATTIKNLNYFIQSGDLKIPPSNEVYVYLDVEENTDLSASYWAGWANAIFTATDPSGLAAFWPAMYSPMTADSSGLYRPHKVVRDALNSACSAAPSSYNVQCYGIWASQPEDVPASCVPSAGPDWSVFAKFSQDLCGTEVAVPVLLYQYIEGCFCVADGYTDFAGLSNSSKFMPCGTTYYPNNNLDLDGSDTTGAETYMLLIG